MHRHVNMRMYVCKCTYLCVSVQAPQQLKPSFEVFQVCESVAVMEI